MASNPIINTEEYKNAELKEYSSIKQLSGATGIPKKLLLLAKSKGWQGFDSSNRVDWRILKPLFETGLDELLSDIPDTLDAYNKEIKKREIKLKDLQIKKLEGLFLEPDEVKKMLVELGTEQSAVIKAIFQELPPLLTGKPEPEIKAELDRAQARIFDVLQKKMKKV